MRGYILVSHGNYAKEFRNSLKMITGDVSDVFVACLQPEEGLEQFSNKFIALKSEMEKYDEVIVFADLIGGTPCNAAVSIYIEENHVSVIGGMNFPMVLAALLSEEMQVDDLISAGKDGIVDAKAKMKAMKFNNEE